MSHDLRHDILANLRGAGAYMAAPGIKRPGSLAHCAAKNPLMWGLLGPRPSKPSFPEANPAKIAPLPLYCSPAIREQVRLPNWPVGRPNPRTANQRVRLRPIIAGSRAPAARHFVWPKCQPECDIFSVDLSSAKVI